MLPDAGAVPPRLTYEGADAPSAETWSRLSSVFALDPDGHVRFKRPALREVAYEGLPYRERRALHAAVGAALERDAGADVDAEPAVLSAHPIAVRPDVALLTAADEVVTGRKG